MGKNKGFTLIEVMVATVIAGLSLGAVCGLMSQCVRTAGITSGYSRAAMLAESKLDELTLDDINVGVQSGAFPGEPNYSWKLEAERTDTAGLIQLSMTVYFKSSGGKREVTLHTLHADRKLATKAD
ncbi:MAG: prepilin-type N-terminal cleavage/methylation domain-containing protein [Planctomycetes bacterium]|nr:prepilin-type N-terminal cleavage/methylation domain-containing protein [Planctomycetota bacterium]